MDVGRKRQSNFNLPPRMHRKGGVYYYVTSGVPRKWIKLHSDLAKARIMWAQIENGTDQSGELFEAQLDQYLLSAEFLSRADKTRRQYESVAKVLKDFFRGARLREIKPSHVALWMDKHKSKIQANTGKAIISNVFVTALRYDLADINPAALIEYHKIDGRDRLISDEEYREIWEKAESHVRIAMDIGYLTGARIQDILDIKLQDVSDDGVFVKVGKTKKRMMFLWSDGLRDVISRARALPRPIRGMHLICNRRGQPYNYTTFNDHWRSAVRDAKVDGVHFHDIRAKAATDAKELGMDYQSLLGHATRAMSDRYIRQREITRVQSLVSTKL